MPGSVWPSRIPPSHLSPNTPDHPELVEGLLFLPPSPKGQTFDKLGAGS